MHLDGKRFWARVARRWSDPARCWLWRGERQHKRRHLAYGLVEYRDHEGQRRRIVAHRAAWLLSGRGIPPGLTLDHRCHNPLCVRPDHLRLATISQQNADTWRAGGRRRARMERRAAA